MLITNIEKKTILDFINYKYANGFISVPNKIRVAAYARKSQEDEACSLETQLSEIHKFYMELKREFLGFQLEFNEIDIYTEDNVSGVFVDNRRELNKLLEKVRKKEYEIVIALKYDRIGRGTTSFEAVRDCLIANCCMLLSTIERDDGSETSELTRIVLGGISLYHARNSAKLSSLAMNFMAMEGKSTGRLPLGFKANKDHIIEVDETEAPIVKLIFSLTAQGESLANVVKRLDELGYKTRDGYNFTTSTITTMLRNEKYDGVYIYNNKKRKESEYRRTHRVLLGRFDEVRIENIIPRIIDHETFMKVQGILDQRKRNHFYSSNQEFKRDYLLSSKIYCKNCMKPMGGSMTSSHNCHYPLYVCSNKKRHVNDCYTKSVNADYIEPIIKNLITQYFNEILRQNHEIFGIIQKDTKVELEMQLNVLKRDLNRTTRDSKIIFSKILEETDELFQKEFKATYKDKLNKIEELNEQIIVTETKLVELNEIINNLIARPFEISEEQLFSDRNIAKRLVVGFIDSIVCDNDEVIIKFK